MAAVRRGSDSGVIVALVVFVVLAIVGIGFSIWFYQQLSMARQKILADQTAFAQTVEKAFTDNGWSLTTQSGIELGFKYNMDTYGQVAQKLAAAAEYEKETLPLLGWDSLTVMRAAMADSPAQRDARAQGLGTFGEMKGLLGSYESSFLDLKAEVGRLRQENEGLAGNLAAAKAELVETERQWSQQLSRATEKFNSDLAKLREDYNDIVAQHGEQQQAAVQWQKKFQDEVNARNREVADLSRQLKMWQARYDEAIKGPGEEEKMMPDGKVLVLRVDYEFVVIEGGPARDLKENARLVVYSLTPDGQDRKKGVIRVGEVGELTALATVSSELEPMLEGDYFVTLARWEQFHATGGGGGG